MNEVDVEKVKEDLLDFTRRNLAVLQGFRIPPSREIQTHTQYLGRQQEERQKAVEETFTPPQQSLYPGLTITSISPTHGPTDGFNQVEIYGTGFNDTTVITFGTGTIDDDDELVLYVSDDGTHMSVQVDQHDAGMVDVTATNPANPDNPAVLEDGYTFDAPPVYIDSFYPHRINLFVYDYYQYPYGNGLPDIHIYGSGFDIDAQVFFGDIEALVLSASETEIVVESPTPQSYSRVGVRVVNPDMQEDTLDYFTFDWLENVEGLFSDGHIYNGQASYRDVYALHIENGAYLDYLYFSGLTCYYSGPPDVSCNFSNPLYFAGQGIVSMFIQATITDLQSVGESFQILLFDDTEPHYAYIGHYPFALAFTVTRF